MKKANKTLSVNAKRIKETYRHPCAKKKKMHPLWFEGKKKSLFYSLSTNLVSVTTANPNITAHAL